MKMMAPPTTISETNNVIPHVASTDIFFGFGLFTEAPDLWIATPQPGHSRDSL
jgi:hypothetical protein